MCSKSESKGKANLTQPEDSHRTLLSLMNKKLSVLSLKKYWTLVKALKDQKRLPQEVYFTTLL